LALLQKPEDNRRRPRKPAGGPFLAEIARQLPAAGSAPAWIALPPLERNGLGKSGTKALASLVGRGNAQQQLGGAISEPRRSMGRGNPSVPDHRSDETPAHRQCISQHTTELGRRRSPGLADRRCWVEPLAGKLRFLQARRMMIAPPSGGNFLGGPPRRAAPRPNPCWSRAPGGVSNPAYLPGRFPLTRWNLCWARLVRRASPASVALRVWKEEALGAL